MNYTTALLDGVAALIADNGLAVYRPDGAYTTGETGVFLGVLPDEPDRAICLTTYAVEDTALTDTITGVQARARAGRDPRDAEDLADALRDLLHMREHYVIGGIHVELSWRNSQAQLGLDTNRRAELAANYYMRTTRTAPHLDE